MSNVEGLAEEITQRCCWVRFESDRSLTWVELDSLLDWLAAHVQAARAEALEEVADDLQWVQPDTCPCAAPESCCGSAESCDAMQPTWRVVDETWLRARAAALRADDAGGEGL